MELVRKYRYITITCFVFICLYSLISLVNHYNFRTYALDLGAYTNALYDYIHFQWNDSSVFKVSKENLLADHFDLYLIVLSPLSLVFGTYTLLIVQIVAIIIGGIGVYIYFYTQEERRQIALFGALYFYNFFGVYNAIAFDYHSNVVAAALIPWLFYFVGKRQYLASSILIILVIVSKENMSLWLAFILLGLVFDNKNDVFLRAYLALGAIFSLISFIVITSIVMPAISNNGAYHHFRYSFFGDNLSQAFINFITHPIKAITVLFTNHNNNLHGNYVKAETHIILFISGFFLLFKKPNYILMLVPIYFQKFFHDSDSVWSIAGQYNIEFAPIFAIGIYSIISEFKSPKLRTTLSYSILILVFTATIRTMDNTVFFTDKTRIRFYQKCHYESDFKTIRVHEYLSIIPKDAKVSAQSLFIPHLSLRDNIYQFPIVKDAEFIIYSRRGNAYPLTKAEFELRINELEASEEWEIYLNKEITILKRRKSHYFVSNVVEKM